MDCRLFDSSAPDDTELSDPRQTYAPACLTMRGKPSKPITPAVPVRLGQGDRSIEDAVSYAVTHRVRIEIRAILNEGTRSQDELAKLVRPPVGGIGYHIRELLADGSIELAFVKRVRNANKHFSRAVEMPFYTDEEIAAMPPAARQAVTGVALQAIMAEALAAFWAGKMVDDRRQWMAWRWFNVDHRGRGDIANEQARSWGRIRDIEAEATNRCAKSSEPTQSIVVSSLGYLRCRNAPLSTAAASPNRPSVVGNVLGSQGRLRAVRP